MRTVFTNARIPGGDGSLCSVSVEGKYISEIAPTVSRKPGDEIVDCRGGILSCGFYNTHCHAPMTVLRGFADDLPLQAWLTEHIFPAEEKLNEEIVYYGTLLAVAEMLSTGTVAFSDMYFFSESVARAVAETGIKANISRSLTLPEGTDLKKHPKFAEAVGLIADFNGYDDGRIIGELCFHAEYTNGTSVIRELASYAAENGIALNFHACETKEEVAGCEARHGMRPIPLFEKLGVFKVPRAYAAHCVYLDGTDRKILAANRCGVAHCPVSNLKLGSGIADLKAMDEAGVLISIGTDGASSNNRLDMLREMQIASLLQKGFHHDPSLFPAEKIRKVAARNGAIVLGRPDCGLLCPGARADLVLFDISSPRNDPIYDIDSAFAYTLSSRDVRLTMVDGKILWKDGEFLSLDIEDVRRHIGKIRETFA